jgi:hypothetical protein
MRNYKEIKESKEFLEYIDNKYNENIGDLFYSLFKGDYKDIDNIIRYFENEFLESKKEIKLRLKRD